MRYPVQALRLAIGLLAAMAPFAPAVFAQVAVAEVLVVEPARGGEPTVLQTRGFDPAELKRAKVTLGGCEIRVIGAVDAAIVIVLPEKAPPADLVVSVEETRTRPVPFAPIVAPLPALPAFRTAVIRPTPHDPETATLVIVVPDDDAPRRLRVLATSTAVSLVRPIAVPWGEDRHAPEDVPTPTLVVTTSGGSPNRAEVRVKRAGPGPLACFVRDLDAPKWTALVDRIEFALPEAPPPSLRTSPAANSGSPVETGRPEFGAEILVRPEKKAPREDERLPARWFIEVAATSWAPERKSDIERATLVRTRVGVRPGPDWIFFLDFSAGGTHVIRRLPATFTESFVGGSRSGGNVTAGGGGGGGRGGGKGAGGGGGGGALEEGSSIAVGGPESSQHENVEVLIGRVGVGREIFALEAIRMILFAEGGRVWLRGKDADGGAIADLGLEVDLQLARHLHMFGAVDGGATAAGNGASALFEGTLGLRWDF